MDRTRHVDSSNHADAKPSVTDSPGTSPDPDTARSGTQPADGFERDVMPLLDQLYSVATRMTSSRAHAEDLIEETCLRAFVEFGSLARGKNLKVWLYRILISTCLNAHREQRGEVDQVRGTTVRRLGQPQGRTSPGQWPAKAELLGQLSCRSVKAALQQLPVEFRIAVHLADVEGVSYKEISEIVDAPVEAVKSRLRQGRQQLQQLLAGAGLSRTANGDVGNEQAPRYCDYSNMAPGPLPRPLGVASSTQHLPVGRAKVYGPTGHGLT